ncbi:MAG: invasin domain 3-containing protein [Desulfococcaceae bacterium]
MEVVSGGISEVVNVEMVAEDPPPLIQGITASATRETIPANGTSTTVITATVTPIDGQSGDGVSVAFRKLGGGGVLNPSEKKTVSGIASSVLTSGTTEETVTIQVEAQGFTDEVQVTYTGGSVQLQIEPSEILADGKETATLTASLKEVSGNPPSPGATVTFDLDNSDLGTITPSSVTTNSNGAANATFQSAKRGGQARITATWEGKGISDSATLTIVPPPGFMEVADDFPDPTDIGVRGTQEKSASTFTFEVSDTSGNPVADGYEILFSIVSGPNGGEELLSESAQTLDGKVSTVLRSGIKVGPVQVRAVYPEDPRVTSNSQISIRAGLPVGENFSMNADDPNAISVQVGDIFGNPVPDGISVSFKTYNTGGSVSPGSDTTEFGRVETSLDVTSGSSPAAGAISVTAETIGDITTRVASMAVFPASQFSHTIFAATNGGGIYKSTNSGASWENISRSNTVVGQNWIQPYVNAVALDPRNPNTVYAGTGFGGRGNVYRSKDGGQNWNSGNREETTGLYDENFAILTMVVDDVASLNENADSGEPYIWVGTDGFGAKRLIFEEGKLTEDEPVSSSPFDFVNRLIKVPGTNREDAVLYAATARGVYRSENGGDSWLETGSEGSSFRGGFVNVLAVHPSSLGGGNDVLYAGTRDSGVWISRDSGRNWVAVQSGATEEDAHIKDLYVDAGNDILYALTFFDSSQEPRPIGNVLSHELESNGAMAAGGWREVGEKLPEAPEDGTRFPLWALAPLPRFDGNPLGDFNDPVALLVGGEGIHLYKATDGIEFGEPDWVASESGISNLIMAREVVSMDVPE